MLDKGLNLRFWGESKMPCSVYFTQQQLEEIQERMKAHAGKYVAKDDKKPENRTNKGLDKAIFDETLDSW